MFRRANNATKDAFDMSRTATSPEAVGEELVRQMYSVSAKAARKISQTDPPLVPDQTEERFTINRYISDDNMSRIGKLKNILKN